MTQQSDAPTNAEDRPGKPGDDVADYGWTEERATPSGRLLGPVVASALSSLDRGARVLDVGCGRGDMARELVELGYRVTGVDPTESGVELARRRVPGARFEVDTASEGLLERLGEEPFDAVVSTEVCEHVYDPFSWARGCHAATAPGGMLVAATPYHGFVKNLAISLTDGWDSHFTSLWVGGHIKFWSTRTFSKLLSECGFGGLEFRYCGRLPLLWKTMVCVAHAEPLEREPG